jgi:hypothetical protein
LLILLGRSPPVGFRLRRNDIDGEGDEVRRLIAELAVILLATAGCSASESPLPVLPFSQSGDTAQSHCCLPYPEGVTVAVNNSWSTEGSHRGRFA